MNAFGIRSGWKASSINDLIQQESAALLGSSYVLVTSLDSIVDLRKTRVAQTIVAQEASCRFLGDGLVILSSLLVKLAMKFEPFHGFDELWCYEQEPELPKPAEVSIVAPVDLRSAPAPAPVVSWLRESRSRLGLGDGIGLNYVTVDDDVGRRLETLLLTDDPGSD